MKSSFKHILTPLLITLGIIGSAVLAYALFVDRAVGIVSFINSQRFAKYYDYNPKHPVTSTIDISKLPPAQAVPILLYHGITRKADTENTTQKNFVSQMEALKRAGYQTITVEQFYQFRQGKFTLPPKPIIITFDDGRKDSFYPTDRVFEKLGFNATMFVATGPLRAGNNFYLTMDELKTVRDTGRWQIEAHGRHSHDHILTSTDTSDMRGRFLSSKQYLVPEARLETPQEFRARIETDYQDNIADLRDNLGVTPHYWAIPLNDYGHADFSNYPEAGSVNESIVKKYFRLAFLQANDSEDVTRVVQPPYNFKGENPYTIRRIEVKNMSADTLLDILERFAPQPPQYSLATDGAKLVTPGEQEGTLTITDTGSRLTASAANNIGLFVVGFQNWAGYTTRATVNRNTTQSVGTIIQYQDEKNYTVCGVSGDMLYIQQLQNGVAKTLASDSRNLAIARAASLEFEVTAHSTSAVSCTINGKKLFSLIRTSFARGQTGIKIWDPQKPADVLIERFGVSS